MSKRYDVKTPRPKKDGSTYWHKIGAAFERDNGGISVLLDSLPIPDKDGRCVMNLWEPMDRDQSRGSDAYREASGGGPVGNAMDDSEIPF